MKRFLISLLALLGCGDEAHVCPAIDEFNGFTIVLDDAMWNPANYSIEVHFTDRFGEQQYLCNVPVPAVDSDAGAGLDGYFNCRVLIPTDDRSFGAEAIAGTSLVLTFSGEPATVDLVVRKQDAVVLDRPGIQLEYSTEYSFGRYCSGSTTAAVRFDLSGS